MPQELQGLPPVATRADGRIERHQRPLDAQDAQVPEDLQSQLPLRRFAARTSAVTATQFFSNPPLS